jgi:hypothetical protein
MADKKISQLTGATTPLAGTEVLPIVQSGSTVKVAVSDLTAGRTVSAGQLNVDNLRLDGNTISSTNTDGAVTIAPNGLGVINLTTSDKVVISNSTTEANLSISAAGTQTNIEASADRGPSATYWNTQNTDGTFSSLDFLKSNGVSVGKIAVQTTSQSGRTGYVSIMTANNAAPVERLTVNNTGDVNVKTGNLIVGTAAKGIDFSANTGAAGETSSLLNWYETGTWTPTLTCSDGNFNSVTYDPLRGGRYTRVGNMVHVQCYMRTDAVDNTVGRSGDVLIAGLPFAAVTASSGTLDGHASLAVSASSAWAGEEPIAAFISGGDTNIQLLYRTAVDGSTSNTVAADVGTGANANIVLIAGTYICA